MVYKNSKLTALIAHNSTFIDFGASQHMFNQKGCVWEYVTNIQINCTKAEQLNAIHIGTVKSNISEILHDALYVPNLKYNLISIRVIIKKGRDIMFKKDSTVITIDNLSMINII